jgi:hypothetical protein
MSVSRLIADAVEDEPDALAPHPERDEAILRKPLHERDEDGLVGPAARHQLDSVRLRRHQEVHVEHAFGTPDVVDHLTARIRR